MAKRKTDDQRMDVWFMEEVCWDVDRKHGQKMTLLVEARSCAEAASLAGEGDGIHEIIRAENLGPIVARPLNVRYHSRTKRGLR